MKSQEGKSTSTIQTTEYWVHEATTASERIFHWQIFDLSNQITEPRHDLGTTLAGIVEPTYISDV